MTANTMIFFCIDSGTSRTPQSIFLRCDSFQMIRIYTSRIFAKMINLHTFFDFSSMKLIRKSVSINLLPINSKDSIFGFWMNRRVSAGQTTIPNPTGIGFFNVFPKSIFRSGLMFLWNKCPIFNISCSMTNQANSSAWLRKLLTILRDQFMSVFAMCLFSIMHVVHIIQNEGEVNGL